MRANMNKRYIFVVDCDRYSGNYERDMTAFMTGRYGECEVGDRSAVLFIEQTGIDPETFDIINVADDSGCHRPCSIFPTPGYFNNGLGGHFLDGQEKQAKEHHRAICLGNVENSRSDNDREWYQQKADKPLVKHPAYQSVAIFISREPTKEEVELFKKRAHAYLVHAVDAPTTIIGFRLLMEETTQTLIWRDTCQTT